MLSREKCVCINIEARKFDKPTFLKNKNETDQNKILTFHKFFLLSF